MPFAEQRPVRGHCDSNGKTDICLSRVLVSVSEMAETKEMVARPVVDGETVSAWAGYERKWRGQRMEITIGLG